MKDSVKNFDVVPCSRSDIREFIETHHYSKNINGCISDYCFKLMRNDEMIGAMFYGKLAMAGQYKRFSDNIDDVIELRRLVCIDDTPRNTESYFIGKTLRWLKKNTKIKIVVSYADQEYGHVGTIYKASNFEYWGFREGAKKVKYNGKLYHDRATRVYYNGELKPFSRELKEALERGEAEWVNTAGKHTFVYKVRK